MLPLKLGPEISFSVNRISLGQTLRPLTQHVPAKKKLIRIIACIVLKSGRTEDENVSDFLIEKTFKISVPTDLN